MQIIIIIISSSSSSSSIFCKQKRNNVLSEAVKRFSKILLWVLRSSEISCDVNIPDA